MTEAATTPAPRRRRLARFVIATLLALVAIVAGLAVQLRIGLGPEVPTPPLVEVRAAPATLLFRDVSVFTGTSPVARPRSDVVVQGGRVIAVRPTGEPPPAGAEIVEGAGRTLLPGFIDAHTHVIGSGGGPWAPSRTSDAHNLEAYVYSGVTTTFALAGLASEFASLEKAMSAGKLIGPRLWYTHTPITAPGGHPLLVGRELFPWPMSSIMAAMIPQPATPAAAEAVVADTVSHDVHFVKAIVDSLPPSAPVMREDVLRALADASHRRKKKLFVHIGTIDDALKAARAGADVLAHGIYRGPVKPAEAEEIARLKVPLIFTLAGWVRTAAIARGAFAPSALDRATAPASILESLQGDAGRIFCMDGAMGEFGAALVDNERFWKDNVRTLHAAGVTMLVGTDSPLPGVFPGSSYHEEMRLLVEAGIPPGEVLLGATARAADVLGLDVGRVEEGRPADLVLVKGDPLTSIADAAAVEMVVLRGKVVKRTR